MTTKWYDAPNSTFIAKVGYDSDNEELHVIINAANGILNGYTYYSVDVETFDNFMNAESMGHYFNENIKAVYDFSS
jgi:hypothetical protein